MRRTLIIALTTLTLLLQGFAMAWAAPSRMAMMEQSADEQAMPCHDQPAADAADTPGKSLCPCCDEGGAMCGKLCGAAGAGLPMQSPALQDYLDAHFESLRSAPSLFPAHSLSRFKPPIAPLS